MRDRAGSTWRSIRSRRSWRSSAALGAPLFERIRSSVVLTEAGKTFLPHAEGVLASMRDGLDAVRALQQADLGAIMLALVGTLASTTLTGCLERFRDAVRSTIRIPGRSRTGRPPGG